jgi:hypothetical protein
MADYEIRDVNNRRLVPLLYLRAYCVANIGDPLLAGVDDTTRANTRCGAARGQTTEAFFLLVRVLNAGRGTAASARFEIGVPGLVDVTRASEWHRQPNLDSFLGKRASVFTPQSALASLKQHWLHLYHRHHLERGISEEDVIWWAQVHESPPIWPSSAGFEIGTLEFMLPRTPTQSELFWVPWRCFAEGMPETRGIIYIIWADSLVHVGNFDADSVSWASELEDDLFESLKEVFNL